MPAFEALGQALTQASHLLRHQIAPPLIALVVFFLLGICLLSGRVAAQPYVPAEDTIVLERVPVTSGSERAELRALRADLAKNPHDVGLATRLARRYLEAGRAEYDPRYSGYAEAALKPWWDSPEPPLAVLVLRATILQNRHRFDDALRDLSQALALAPRNAQAWLTQAAILRVKGEPHSAAESCRRLFGLADLLLAMTCMSDAASLSGQAQAGYERLLAAYERADGADPRQRLYALTVLGEIAARLGDARAAERHFREALSLGLRDGYLIAAFADLLLDQRRAKEARELLRGSAGADALLLRLSLAERQLGSDEAERHVETLTSRFAASRARGEQLHLREEARFALELQANPTAALGLAERNWQVQREPADARIVLEAALAAGTPERAKPVLMWLEEHQVEDVALRTLSLRLREASR
jgi:tetratricopeptide (TPR) repeat protein